MITAADLRSQYLTDTGSLATRAPEALRVIGETRQARLAAAQQMTTEARAAGRSGLLASEQRTFDSHMSEVNALDLLTAEVRQYRVETDPIVNPGGGEHRGEDRPDDPHRVAFGHWIKRGMAQLEPQHRDIMAGTFGSLPTEARAQAVGSGAAGGYLVPEGFRQKLIERMKRISSVRRVVETITTETGNTVPWPTVDDTGNKGAILAENTQAAEQDLVYGTNDLSAFMYTSKIVRVSFQYLQDVDWMNAESHLADQLAKRIARAQNEHFTTGTGTAQPQGIVTGATNGVTAAAVADIALDELIDLTFTVDADYREAPGTGWMMSDTAFQILRKKKNSDNDYIIEPDVKSGAPNSLFGYPITINNDMAAPATGVKSVLFGNFRAGYVVRDVRDVVVLDLRERYADFLQVGFLGFHRSDATVQDANAYKALVQA